MARDAYRFSDNTCVKSCMDGNDYLSISLADAWECEVGDGRKIGDPEQVILCRYTVPGRSDDYSFKMSNRSESGPAHLCFFTDHGLTIGQAGAMATRDLNKQNVVEMFTVAFDQKTETNFRFLQEMQHIVNMIAPTSKVAKELERIHADILARRTKRWDLRKKQADALKTAGLPIPAELRHCKP